MQTKIILAAAALLLAQPALATGKPKPPAPPSQPPASWTYSPHTTVNPHQYQGQGQGQVATGGNATGGDAMAYGGNGGNATGGAGGAGGNGGQGGAGGQGGRGGYSSNISENTTSSRSSQSTTVNANSYTRQVRQAPALAAQFSSIGQGNPCEGVPFGMGATTPWGGGLFQLPRESSNCWAERRALLAVQLGASRNAGLAILAGNDVGTAVANNPADYYQPRRAYSKQPSRRYKKPCRCK